ncbi:MAG: hypothetical protein ACYTG3_10690 [Planctomycetota bacterium]|jgi:hypothetical protein
MSYPRLFGLLLLLGAAACTSYRITYDADSSVAYNEGVEKSLKVEAVWLKPRGEFVHVLLRYTNWYANPVTVDSEAVTMVVNDAPAHLHKAVKAQTVVKGETRQTTFIFKLKGKVSKGTAVVTLRPLAGGGQRLPAATLELPVKP